MSNVIASFPWGMAAICVVCLLVLGVLLLLREWEQAGKEQDDERS